MEVCPCNVIGLNGTVRSLGLGAAMNGIVPAVINKNKTVRELLEIPDGHEAVISLILGYPNYKYQRTLEREEHTLKIIAQ